MKKNWAQSVADNLNRNVMLEHIENVEKGIVEPDEDYHKFVKIKDKLQTLPSFQKWKRYGHMTDKARNIFFWVVEVFIYSLAITLILGFTGILSAFLNEIWLLYGRLVHNSGGFTYLVLLALGLIAKLVVSKYRSYNKKL